MAGNSALDTSEDDFSLPGEDDSAAPAASLAPPSLPAQPLRNVTPQPPQNATATPSSADGQPPKASGRTMFLGNLLKTILSGVQNASGNPNNAFDRGFMGASPQAVQQRQNQQQMAQAKVQQAMSEADQSKMQTSLTGMKVLQTEYLIKRLPQDQAMKYLKTVSDFKDNLIKEGASVEAEGDDEKASDANAVQMNANDPRAKEHAGKFYSLPTIDSEGKAKFDTVYVPTKDTLQNDWTSPDGKIKLDAGMPMGAAFGKVVDELQKGAQDDTKSEHKMMADALKPNVSDAEANNTISWLESQKKQNTPLYQQNKNSVDAQINTLKSAHSRNQADKIQQAKAMATQVTIPTKEAEQADTQEAKDKQALKGGQDALNYADTYIKGGQYTGPGDEALMEKFFELAKPSTGFRMSQPQIDMLKNARSWLDSAEAKTRHATDGTWFSGTQRQQIAGTMKQLATAKGVAVKTGDMGRPVKVNGKVVGYTTDGKTMTPVQ